MLRDIQRKLREGVAVGAGLAAGGGGRDAGDMARQAENAILVGGCAEGLRTGADAVELVEAAAWANREVGFTGLWAGRLA